MLFHTWTFGLFFLVSFAGYLLLKRTRVRLPWLLAASYVFYGWWNPLYLILIVWSTSVDFLAVRAMARSKRRVPWLAASILNNLGLLGFFKYGGFVVENLNHLLASFGVPYEIASPGFLLPVGISFYVFQSMSYTIDYYRGQIDEEPNFIRYATFVALFPQLVAGPIERARNLLPQLRRTPEITLEDFADGASLFIVGLFKKVALADYLALYVDQVYATPGQYGSAALLMATFAFGWQIYFDFSGYTDMARGVGRTLGIRFMLNFNNPYLATGLSDFWRRWHISLSTWFRDYVYIPLGGSRRGTLATYVNLWITMLVSGLWHGAAWNFVIWGALHAFGYSLTRHLEFSEFYRSRVPKWVKQAGTFVFVTFAWIFFRARSFDDARTIVTRIAHCYWDDPRFPLLAVVLIFAVWGYQFLYESKARRILQWPTARIIVLAAMIVYLVMFAASSNQAFIYFQF